MPSQQLNFLGFDFHNFLLNANYCTTFIYLIVYMNFFLALLLGLSMSKNTNLGNTNLKDGCCIYNIIHTHSIKLTKEKQEGLTLIRMSTSGLDFVFRGCLCGNDCVIYPKITRHSRKKTFFTFSYCYYPFKFYKPKLKKVAVTLICKRYILLHSRFQKVRWYVLSPRKARAHAGSGSFYHAHKTNEVQFLEWRWFLNSIIRIS